MPWPAEGGLRVASLQRLLSGRDRQNPPLFVKSDECADALLHRHVCEGF